MDFSNCHAHGVAGPSVLTAGPTALSYILHSMPSLPLSALTEFDAEGYSMEASWMDVRTPPAAEWHDSRGEDAVGHWDRVTDRLLRRYWAEAVLPIVIPSDLDGLESGPLRRAMAAVAAARGAPVVVFDALKALVQRDIEDGGEWCSCRRIAYLCRYHDDSLRREHPNPAPPDSGRRAGAHAAPRVPGPSNAIAPRRCRAPRARAGLGARGEGMAMSPRAGYLACGADRGYAAGAV